jgi:hypothetical protein
MKDAFDDRNKELAELLKALGPLPEHNGLAVFINGKLAAWHLTLHARGD